MEALAKTTVLEFHPDTLQNVRREFNLEEPKRLEEAIDLLLEWARKQEHFTVKEFDRVFIEKLIIQNKGLLERAKKRLDKQCTFRTLLPDYFRPINVKTELRGLDFMVDAVLPKLTPENYRVFFLKNIGKQFKSKLFMDYYVRAIHYWQYLQRHDYNAGLIIIYDLTEANIKEYLSNVNWTEFRDYVTLITDILPSEYGGKEKLLVELHQEWLNVLSSDDHLQYMKKMNELGTNETKRQLYKFNEEYLGMPGTFSSLSVD